MSDTILFSASAAVVILAITGTMVVLGSAIDKLSGRLDRIEKKLEKLMRLK